MNEAPSIILFDGVCNLCAACVRFVVPRDKKKRFLFASLQSNFAKELLQNHQYKNRDLASVILVEKGMLYTRSTAALRIVRHLQSPACLLWPFMMFPRSIRDYTYDYVGRNRYKWFGKKEACWIPDKTIRDRFIKDRLDRKPRYSTRLSVVK